MEKVLILDNYDSFTYNLYQFIAENNVQVQVFKNDEIDLPQISRINPSHIVISPGPGSPENPNDVGVCMDVIKYYSGQIPILGVCLGHQMIIHFFGGKVIKADKVMHGKTSVIYHNEEGIFSGIRNNIKVMRYHSLIGESASLPECLQTTAFTKISDDVVDSNVSKDTGKVLMGIKHKKYPLFGIQFHPESIGTEFGKEMLKNFIFLHQQ